MRTLFLKLSISFAALGLLVTHILRPELKVDAITLGLLVLAITPWLSRILQEVEFPGGWKVKFREVQAAGEKVTDSLADAETESLIPKSPRGAVSVEDPNLALVGLRIEIERRLRELGRKHQLPERGSVIALLRDLKDRDVFDESSADGLESLIAAGNKAAHGAKVEKDAALWAVNSGSAVLAALDAKLNE